MDKSPQRWQRGSMAVAVVSVLTACGVVPKPPADIQLDQSVFAWNGRRVRIESYSSHDAQPPQSTVFLLHGIGGIPGDGAMLREVAFALARSGHEAVVVRYFDATGHWVVSRGLAMRRGPEWRQVLRTIAEAHRAANPDRMIGLLGFSLGGFLAVALAAEDLDVDALAVMSAGVLPEHEERDFSVLPPLLILNGGRDFLVEPERSAVLERLAAQAGVDVERQIFENEGHVFGREAKHRVSADMVRFFNRYLQTGQSVPENVISRESD